MDNLKQFSTMGPDDNWRTQSFRQGVVAKIEEAIHHSGMKVARNSSEMENHVFMKAKSREEYMNMVAKLILHVREMSQPKPNPGAGGMVNQGPPGPNQQVQTQPGQNPQGNQSGMNPDPINALQTLASQAQNNNRNAMMNMGPQSQMGPQVMGPNPGMMPQMSQQGPMVSQPQPQTATNLLQTLNQRPQLNMQMPNKMGGQMMMPNQGQMGGSMMGMGNPMGGQIQNQLGGPNMQGQMMGNMAMGNNMQGPMGGVGGMGNQMPCNQVVGGMGNQMPGQSMQGQMVGNMQGNQMVGMNMLHMGRGVNVPNKEVMGGNVVGNVYRGPTHNQFLRQSPSPSAPSPSMPGPSPVSMGVMGGGGPLQSPMSAMGCGAVGSPSPSAPMGSHHHQGQRTVTMNIASPSSSLNTPGGAGSSPGGEEAAYREKVRQLAKYIEPLRRMINRMVSEGENVEKLTKMKNLLDILSNPNKRMPLETLIKCEVVLEKLDFKRSEGLGLGLQVPSGKEQIFNPLLEVVNNCLQSPIANHTLKRTFGTVLDSLNGPELKNLPAPVKQPKLDEPPKEIPEVLQGEIARLDSRFKVSLDPMQLSSDEGSISLFAQLDSDKVPCVPPLRVKVPRDYPSVAPTAKLKLKANKGEKDSFLAKLQRAMEARCKRLPKSCSVGQLLDAWEMSVRQACAPNNNTSYNPVPALGI